MESINAELEVIKMIEEELESREGVDVLNHRLKRIKNLASSIQDMIKSKNVDSEYIQKLQISSVSIWGFYGETYFI